MEIWNANSLDHQGQVIKGVLSVVCTYPVDLIGQLESVESR